MEFTFGGERVEWGFGSVFGIVWLYSCENLFDGGELFWRGGVIWGK